MAKYTITYRCGHTAEVQLYGPYADREKKIAYYKTINCPDCRAKAAGEDAQKKGYAELTGSAKQVSWANSIRSKMMHEVDELAAKVTRNKEMFDKAVETLKNETSASWWIDRRDNTVMDLIKEVLHI
jgi:hypothetical protein